MFSVKRECGAEICRGCLSTDRRLSPLSNNDLFLNLLNDKQRLKALKPSTMLLCWECGASLRRFQQFQAQVQNAHRFLEEIQDELPIQGLSKLTTTFKEDYDAIIKDKWDCLIPIKNEETKIRRDVLNVQFKENDDDDDSEDNFVSFNRVELEQETTDNHLDEASNTKKAKRKIKTEKQPAAKIKRKKLETKTSIENKKKVSKKDTKTKKVNNTIKREVKKEKTTKITTEISQDMMTVKTENKTPDIDDTGTTETNKDSEENTEKYHLQNLKVEIEIDRIEDDENASDDDSESDDGGSDGEEESSKTTQRKYKRRDGPRTDPFLRCKLIRFSRILLDTYFTKVKLDRKEKKVVLDNELSYKTKESPHGCNHCGFLFQCTKSLMRHKFERHKKQSVKRRKNYVMYKCNICQKINRKEHVAAHMMYFHRYQYFCKECDKEFWVKEEGRAHYKEAHEDMFNFKKCEMCNLVFGSMKSKDHHMRTIHTRIPCDVCNKLIRGYRNLKAHKQRLHNPDSTKPEGEAREEMISVKCDLCNYVSKSLKSKDQHMRATHTPMPCDVCEKVILGYKNLKSHKQRQHDSDGSAPELRYCVSCDKQFLSIFGYQAHIKHSRVHAPDERFPCTACGKVLLTQRSLKTHYEGFHSDKKRYQCSQCDKCYHVSTSLRSHMEKVHLKKEPVKNKLCTICGRGFAISRSLVYHMRTHTGEKPHRCPLCPAAFTQPYSVRVHLAEQHPGARQDKPPPPRRPRKPWRRRPAAGGEPGPARPRGQWHEREAQCEAPAGKA